MTTRETGKLKIAAVGDRDVVMTREFNAPRPLVYKAFTTPELVKRWLLGPDGWTMIVCTIDLQVGGSYRYEWKRDNGTEEMGLGGVYQEVVPNERVVATEKCDMAWYPGGAIVATRLTEANGITTVETTVTYDTKEACETVLRSPMDTGIEASYTRLDSLLAAGLV